MDLRTGVAFQHGRGRRRKVTNHPVLFDQYMTNVHQVDREEVEADLRMALDLERQAGKATIGMVESLISAKQKSADIALFLKDTGSQFKIGEIVHMEQFIKAAHGREDLEHLWPTFVTMARTRNVSDAARSEVCEAIELGRSAVEIIAMAERTSANAAERQKKGRQHERTVQATLAKWLEGHDGAQRVVKHPLPVDSGGAADVVTWRDGQPEYLIEVKANLTLAALYEALGQLRVYAGCVEISKTGHRQVIAYSQHEESVERVMRLVMEREGVQFIEVDMKVGVGRWVL